MRKRAIPKVVQLIFAALLTGSLLTGCLPGNGDEAKSESSSPRATLPDRGEVSIEEAEKALRGVKGLVESSKDEKLPVQLDDPTGRIELTKDVYIHLPGNNYTEGKEIVPGLAVFGGENYNTSAVQVTRNGQGRLLNILTDKRAPQEFRYKLDMPPLYQLRTNDDGVAYIVDTTDRQKIVYAFPPPWARDAKGKELRTYYTSDGYDENQYLVQGVVPKKSSAYPIVADPHAQLYWNGAVVTLSQNDMQAAAIGGFGVTGILAASGIGLMPAAISASITAGLTWAYMNSKCLWVWVPLGWTGIDPSFGWYDCLG